MLGRLVAWRYQAETPGTILGAAAATGNDGSVFMAGSVKQETTDFSAVKLDADGNMLWEWQVTNTTSGILLSRASRSLCSLRVDSVTQRVPKRTRSSDHSVHNLSSTDRKASTLTANAAWMACLCQGGSSADDRVHAVATTEDGSVILAGSTTGVLGEVSMGSGDFAAIKLDADGYTVWTWQVNCVLISKHVETELETSGSVSID